MHPRMAGLTLAVVSVIVATALAACDSGVPPATPPDTPDTPGTSGDPREVIIVMRDYAYGPPVLDLVPGETVLLQVVNGGLDVHEAVIGDLAAQVAWEAAEAPHADPPPGPTPTVAAPPGFVGIRVVAKSGERVDVTWTVPADAPDAAGGWFVGCHIPGHWEKGMVAPVRFVDDAGVPLGTVPPVPLGSPGG
jgi:hypothetical protein